MLYFLEFLACMHQVVSQEITEIRPPFGVAQKAQSMTSARSFSCFELVLHEDDARAFKQCPVLAAPSEMDAMRSAFDSQLVTMTIELPMTAGVPRMSATLNVHFEVAGAQREYIRFAARTYQVSRPGPRAKWRLKRGVQFSGSYHSHTRDGFVFLTVEQIFELHQYMKDETNTLVGNTTGRLFVYR